MLDDRPPAALLPTRPGVTCASRTQSPRRLYDIGRQRFAAAVSPSLVLMVGLLTRAAAGTPPSATDDSGPTVPEPVEMPAFVLVEGQVTDAVGGGQQAVAVTVYRTGPDGTRGEKLAEAPTDTLGDFRVTTPEPHAGELIVVLTKAGFAEFEKTVIRTPDELPPYVVATLKGSLSLTGRVKDAHSGKPVAGALVTLESYEEDKHATTDVDGRFNIGNVPPGPCELVLVADGFGREHERITPDGTVEDLVIELKPERIVHVQVLNDTRDAVAGALVELYDTPRDDLRTVITDENGRATVAGIHADADTLRARLSHPEHVASTGFDHEVELPAGQSESRHTLSLVRGGTITGVVLEGETREPVYSARVVTGDRYSDDTPRAWTDAEGRFTIPGVHPGPTTLTAHRSGFAPELRTTQVLAGETATVRFKLAPPLTLSGSVTGKDGMPVANAYVETTRWRERATLGLRATTDADGRFVISDAPSDEVELTVFADGYAAVTRTAVAGAGDPTVITLTEEEASEPEKPGPTTGDPAPDLTVTTLDGSRFVLADLKGKTVLLNFWATWCPPCVDEIDDLVKIHERLGDRDDFVMMGISRDFEKSDLQAFLRRKQKVTWPQAVGAEGGVPQACEAFGVSYVPRIFIIGPDGRIALHHLRRGEDLLEKLGAILKQNEGT